jgi:hypothetical protein
MMRSVVFSLLAVAAMAHVSETILWGVDISNRTLRTFNAQTGAPTGAVPLLNAAGAPVAIVSIAYDVVTNTLYGNTTPVYSGEADTLYVINPATGAVTPIGAIGFAEVYALGFDQGGTLFGVADVSNELISINTGSGLGASIAVLAVGRVFDLASRPEDDLMFLADSDSGTFSLYTVNTGNGALNTIGPYGANINIVGLAFLVPEPTTLGLFGLGVLALGFIRRRRTA